MTELEATADLYPSSLQIVLQAVGKAVFQTVSRVIAVFAGGLRARLDEEDDLPRRRLYGQVFLKRSSGRAFLVDAKRSGAWKPLVSHHFRLGGSADRRLLVSRSGWVAVVGDVKRVRSLPGLVIYDLQTESPSGSGFVSLVGTSDAPSLRASAGYA